MNNCMSKQLIAWVLLAFSASALAAVPPIIDTHTHLENTGNNFAAKPNAAGFSSGANYDQEMAAAVERMDRYGIQRMLLMPPPAAANTLNAYDIGDLQSAAKKYSNRISLIGGGGSLNMMIQSTPADAVTDDIKQQFRERAEQIAEYGAVAFGEMAAHHLSLRIMGPQHPYESVQPDHPLLLLLADIAAEKHMPIDLHIDLVPEDMDRPQRPIFNPATPSHLQANQAGFERLLDHNPNAKIIWAHAGTDPLGTRRPGLERHLLKKHPNLYMSLRLAANGPAPAFALDQDLHLKPEWLALLKEFPDRFVLGSDFFHTAANGSERGPKEKGFSNFAVLLEQLPPDLAEAIAHGNAEKLYHLPAH